MPKKKNKQYPKAIQISCSWTDDELDKYSIKDGGWSTANLSNEIVASIDADVINDIVEIASNGKSFKKIDANSIKYNAIDTFLENPFTLNFEENIIVINDELTRKYTISLAGPIGNDDCMMRIKVKSNEIRVFNTKIEIGTNNTVRTELPKFIISNINNSEHYTNYFNKILAAIEDKTGTPISILFHDKVSYISP